MAEALDFRLMFAEEARSRMDSLAQQLLELETSGGDEALIAGVFREAHTLKGSAAVVGLAGAERVAHALEDLLEDVRRGHRGVTAEIVDAALAAVDALRRIIEIEVQGGDATEPVKRAILDLATAISALPPGPEVGGSRQARATPAGEEAAVQTEAVAAPDTKEKATVPDTEEVAPMPRSGSAVQATTLRVPVSRMDQLVRLVGESAAAQLRLGRRISDELERDPTSIPEFRDLTRILTELQETTMRSRMVPVASVSPRLQQAVRDLARSQDKQVRWEFRGEDTELDRGILEHLADPLLHIVRNAVDHGIELPAERVRAGKDPVGTVRLHAMQMGPEVVIAVSDDGRGIDIARVREEGSRADPTAMEMPDDDALYLVFRSGLSTSRFVTDVSGRGVGLDVVRSHVVAVRGRVDVRSTPGEGTEFRLAVPITLALLPCLLLTAGGSRYAIPLHTVVRAEEPPPEEVRVEGRPSVMVDGRPVPYADLARILGASEEPATGPVVVLSGLTRSYGFRVDALLGQREVVVKGLGRHLPRLDVVAGASVEPDGSIVLVLEPPGLIDAARRAWATRRRLAQDMPAPAPLARGGVILVVDDALTVRELQRSILEGAGYEVQTAVDGAEALAMLAQGLPDLVLTDVEMPRVDGFALTEAIRAQPRLSGLPVIILTSHASEEDRRRGLEAGADGYLVKSSFDQSTLLRAVERLLGKAP